MSELERFERVARNAAMLQGIVNKISAKAASGLIVIGIDPGPTTGFAVLRWDGEPGAWRLATRNHAVFQCAHGSALWLFDRLIEEHPHVRVAIERFILGRISRASKHDGEITRDLIGALVDRIVDMDASRWRPAAAVKPWATDDRLAYAGLLDPTKGMPHARDAGRHALFSGVSDYGAPDPMSKRGAK